MLYLYILISILFAIIIRILPSFFNDIQPIISNPDGFYFANYTKMLFENKIPISDIPSNAYFSYLLYIVYTPFSSFIELNDFLYYITPILASTISIPIILISNQFGNLKLGFLASLISTVEIYYHRTTLGRLDTDFIAILFPLGFVYFMIKMLNTKDDKFDFGYLAFLIILLIYIQLYPSGIYLSLFLVVFSMFYIYLFDKSKIKLGIEIGLLNIIVVSKLILIYKVSLLVFFCLLYKSKFYKIKIDNRIVYFGFGFLILIVLTFFSNTFYHAIVDYIMIDNHKIDGEIYYNAKKLLGETRHLSIMDSINAIGVNIYIFVLGMIGYVLLVVSERKYLLLMPILILGLMVFASGGRYGFYAWVVLSFGLSYLILRILNLSIKNNLLLNLSLVLIIITYTTQRFTFYSLYKDSMLSSYSKVLPDIKLSHNDNFLSSTRNGYMLSYYTGARSFIDGGRNSGKYQYFVSNIFLEQNQSKSYKMTRWLSNNFDRDNYNISYIAHKYGFNSPSKLITNIDKIKIKDDNRTNYIYITDQMFELMNNFHYYSYIDLKSGYIPPVPMFFIASSWRRDSRFLYFGHGIKLFHDLKVLVMDNDSLLFVKRYIEIDYKDKLEKREILMNQNGTISILFIKHLNKIVVFDDRLYKSFYIQLYLENYDRDLFSPIYLDATTKIYKLL